MSQKYSVVIAGGGHAAAEAAVALRSQGYAGSIVLIGEEPTLPYARPPLSKGYQKGDVESEALPLRPSSFYERQQIDLRLGVRVEHIDRSHRRVRTSTDEWVEYESLILALGGRARRLGAPVVDGASNVCYLRSLSDAAQLKGRLARGGHLLVIGAGYIGLELAATARHLGAGVTVVESAPRVLARVTSPVVSRFFDRVHREEGVDIRLQAGLEDLDHSADGSVTSARLADGTQIVVDAMVVGIGLVPNVQLATEAGLATDDGVLVDGQCRTSDPAIFAIGDCSRHPDPIYGTLRRLESVPNAVEHARMAAAAICGRGANYDATPWFWSDQYDVRLKTVGIMRATDTVIVRGNPDVGRSFSAFYLRDGIVAAADVLSSAKDFAAARALVSGRVAVAPDLLANVDLPMKDLVSNGARR